LIMFVTKDSTW